MASAKPRHVADPTALGLRAPPNTRRRGLLESLRAELRSRNSLKKALHKYLLDRSPVRSGRRFGSGFSVRSRHTHMAWKHAFCVVIRVCLDKFRAGSAYLWHQATQR